MPPSQSDCRGTGYHAISSWHCVPTASKIRFTGGRTRLPDCQTIAGRATLLS
jgi:hypothetical protein